MPHHLKIVCIAIYLFCDVSLANSSAIVVQSEHGCVEDTPVIRFLVENNTGYRLIVRGLLPWRYETAFLQITAIAKNGQGVNANIPYQGYGPHGLDVLSIGVKKQRYIYLWDLMRDYNHDKYKHIKGYIISWEGTFPAYKTRWKDEADGLWIVPVFGVVYFPVREGKVVCEKQFDPKAK